MHKRFSLLFIVLLAVLSLVSVVQAAPAEDLTPLAHYYPLDTPFFASMRIDEGLFDELDAMMFTLANNLGEEMNIPPGLSTRDLLNMAVGPMLAGRLSEAFGTWLGDSAAIGLSSLDVFVPRAAGMEDPDPPVLIAIAINDREKATEFVTFMFGMESPVEPEITHNYTLFKVDMSWSLLVTNDAILFTNNIGTALDGINGADGRLSENALFSDATATLPAEDYDIFFFGNLDTVGSTLRDIIAIAADGEGLPPEMINGVRVATENAAITIGLNISEGRNLIFDVATRITPKSILAMREEASVNLEIAERVPADAPFVLFDNAFGPDMLDFFDMLDLYGAALQQSIDMMLPMINTELAAEDDPGAAVALEILNGLDLSLIQLGGITKNAITPVFAGFTGLNLEEDVLRWMTGDYAAYLRILPSEGALPLTVDVNFTTVAADPAKAAYMVERLTQTAEQYEVNHVVEDIAGGKALALTDFLAELSVLITEDAAMAAMLAEDPQLDLMIAANANVLSMGNRPGVEFALLGDGDSLLDTAEFAHARKALFLDGASSILYISPQSLAKTIGMLGLPLDRDGAQLMMVLSQMESITLSTAYPNNTVSQARFTLTLPE